MTTKLNLAVIIPAFNSEATIRRALNSVSAQTYLPSRIIIVDDHSSDRTVDEVSSFCAQNSDLSVTLLQNNRNLGPGLTRNLGWELSDNEWIAFLDSDDSWVPNKLEIQFRLLAQNPGLDLICSESRLYSERSEIVDTSYVKNLQFISFSKMLFRNLVQTRTVVMRRDIPFRFEKGLSEDYGLWLKCLNSGLRFAKIPLPLAIHYRPEFSEGGLSSQLLKHELFELRRLLGQFVAAPFLVGCATLFSLVKFARRVVIKFLRGVKK
jgi:glycosyltransferase involved in cell wall biosynthesis